MMNINSFRDIYHFPYVPYGLLMISDQNLPYVQCNSTQNPYYLSSTSSESVLIDQLQEYHSKNFQSIILSSEDLSENKETSNFHGQTYTTPFNNLKDSHIRAHKQSQRKTEKNKNKVTLRNGKAKEFKQKQNRNIYSNLLRIFMRNLLELGNYESLIERIVLMKKLTFSASDFYRWLYSFKINFKNYIRIKQLASIFTSPHSLDYQATFVLLLQNFLNNYCTEHCLTSRKISGNGRKLHLEGARLLRRAVQDLANKKC